MTGSVASPASLGIALALTPVASASKTFRSPCSEAQSGAVTSSIGSLGVQAARHGRRHVEGRLGAGIHEVVVEESVHQLVGRVPLVDALGRVVVAEIAEEELDRIRGVERSKPVRRLDRLERGEERIGESLHPEDRNLRRRRDADRALERSELVDAVRDERVFVQERIAGERAQRSAW